MEPVKGSDARPAHEYDSRYLEYIKLFNERDFYDSHEVLEDLWHDDMGERRRFYQGLIHFAAAFHLLWRRNLSGFKARLDTARDYLENYPDKYEGLDIAEIRLVIGRWEEKITGLDEAQILDYDDSMIPQLKLS